MDNQHNDTILKIEGVTKVYPGVCALNDVSFEVKKGQVHALMGENGAGKSTLIKVISGAIHPEKGSIWIDGKSYEHLTPARAMELGIGVIYQEFNNVPSLSVTQNVFLGKRVGGRFMFDLKEMRRRTKEIFESLGVSIPVDAMVGNLSVAQQQIVEIARALSQNIKVLIMDEPSATLAIAEVRRLFDIILKLKKQGVTTIYISHRMEEVFELADSITILRDGCHVKTCPMEGMTRKEIIRAMVGRELVEDYPSRSTQIGPPVLEVEHLTGNGDTDISLTLHKGEVLGLAGLVGAGRTELAKVIYGVTHKESGTIKLKGEPVDFRAPRDALNAGVGYISENRKTEGVFLDFPISWNITISALRRYSKLSFTNKAALENVVKSMSDRFRIKAPTMEQLVRNLSGGNQQKVALAKVLALDTDVVIFDEPTRGIDVGVKQEIYQIINEMVERGISIIMISSEMEELIGMSDRIVVLHEGRITGELEKKDFDQQKILEYASGIQH